MRDTMQTLLAEILAAWRCAERLTNAPDPDTPRHAAAVACERLGDLYRDLTESVALERVVVDLDPDGSLAQLVADVLGPSFKGTNTAPGETTFDPQR